jgi:outer membrane immunogenic protein
LGIIGTLVDVPVVQTTTGGAFIGGIEAGDRYQFGKLVLGWEADWAWGNIGGTSTTSFGPSFLPGVTFTQTLNTSVKWTGTATSSVGIANDRWLIYGKAGVAWAHLDDTASTIVSGGGTTPFFSGVGGTDRVGWTVGTGIEWAIWNNWSVKAEYDYLDFGTKVTPINGTVLPALAGGLPVQVGLQDTLHVNPNWHILPSIW